MRIRDFTAAISAYKTKKARQAKSGKAATTPRVTKHEVESDKADANVSSLVNLITLQSK